MKILKYALAYDIGKAVNPMIVDGQLMGAIAQGIGGALLDRLRDPITADEGQQLLSGLDTRDRARVDRSVHCG